MSTIMRKQVIIRALGAKVVLIANKADTERVDVALGEFARLGFGTPVGVSAIQDRNLEQIFDAIRGLIAQPEKAHKRIGYLSSTKPSASL